MTSQLSGLHKTYYQPIGLAMSLLKVNEVEYSLFNIEFLPRMVEGKH